MIESEQVPQFGIEGGPTPVQKDVVEHDAIPETVVEQTDFDSSTANLQTATVVKPTEEATVVHQGDTSIWRPDVRGKVAENKEVLEQLEKLVELKAMGALTEEEFTRKKRELLN